MGEFGYSDHWQIHDVSIPWRQAVLGGLVTLLVPLASQIVQSPDIDI